jgi:DNA uptake protein ComE-like DNA-binding protein
MRSFALATILAIALALGAATASIPSTPAVAQASLIDINSASKESLESLKGVGPVRADAIIKGRPYKGKDELIQKKFVPQSVYDEIKDKIIARQRS